MIRNLSSFVVVACLAASPASAQRADFSALRDTLERLNDSAALRRIEAERRPPRNATSDQQIAHGFIALRLYSLTHEPAFCRRATKSFENALDRNPGVGWAHYGLGLSLAHSPEARPLNEGGSRGRLVLDDVYKRLTGKDARSRARAAFNAALHTVPPIHGAARELATLSLEARKPEWLREARTALETLTAEGGAQPDDRVALVSVQTALNELEAAVASADAALATNGRTGGTLLVAAIARLRSAGHEREGAQLYFEGVRAATPEELERYYDDMLPIADAREKSRWENGNTETRRALLLGFFDLRAGLGGVLTTERLAEHYRRLPHVEQHFRRLAQYGAPLPNELRWLPIQKQSRFDDRGEIYLRHGAPDRTINTVTPAADAVSWLYRLSDGTLRMFHFIRARGGYTLPYIVPCGTEFLDDRAPYDARLGHSSLRRCDAASASLYSAAMRAVYFEALKTDTHFPRFTRELPFFYDLYTFRGQPGKTAVVAAFAVPATRLEKTVDDSGVHYRFDVSLILADTALGTVSRTDDSASVRMPRALSEEDLLRTHLEVQVSPSGSTLQRVIMTDPTAPGIGQLYGGPFPIPDYSGNDLMLSDIALGQNDRLNGWKRGAVTLMLVPTSQFPTGSFTAYYEIYNLPADREYTTEVLIERIDKGAGDRIRGLFGAGDDVRFKFSGESTAGPDGTLPELRRMEAPLRKGRYRMTVTVRDHETGQTATRSRVFSVPD